MKDMKYEDIGKVLEDFANSYARLKELSKDMTRCLHGNVRVITCEDSDNRAYKFINDTDYVRGLSEAVSELDCLSTMRVLVSIVEELTSAIAAKRRTADKLKIRAASDKGNESNNAKSLLSKYNADIRTLEERMTDCINRFYSLRRTVVNFASEQSRLMASLFIGEYVESVDKAIRKHRFDDGIMSCDSEVVRRK